MPSPTMFALKGFGIVAFCFLAYLGGVIHTKWAGNDWPLSMISIPAMQASDAGSESSHHDHDQDHGNGHGHGHSHDDDHEHGDGHSHGDNHQHDDHAADSSNLLPLPIRLEKTWGLPRINSPPSPFNRISVRLRFRLSSSIAPVELDCPSRRQ